MKDSLILFTGIALSMLLLTCSSPQIVVDPIEMDGQNSWVDNQPVPKSVIQSTRSFRERLLQDPFRPAYHFTVPEDKGIPGDPNGAFYANGRYHLMYLYLREGGGFSYGHISSKDLLHWRHHPDAIGAGRPEDGPGNQEDGVFSGGGFLDDDGTAYITYWQFEKDNKGNEAFKDGKSGIAIAKSSDKHFDNWTKVPENPAIASTEWGITVTKDNQGKELIYGSADPSQIWKKNGRYYMLTGNLLVLRKYGSRGKGLPANMEEPSLPKDSVDYQGDQLYLFASDDLKNWEYLHKFYERNPAWTEKTEDNMCPSFLPLPSNPDGGTASDKHLLLFISHNLGCQYYVGDYKNDRFYPNNHGRMSWIDNAYFAPEALTAGDGRQIMWAWMHDGKPDSQKEMSGNERWAKDQYGWTGTFGLPRSLWVGEDGTLRMRPIKELANLRQNERTFKNLKVSADTEMPLSSLEDELLELEITVNIGNATQFGVKVNCSEDGQEETILMYDASTKEISLDASKSSLNYGSRKTEKAPFALKDEELLTLRVFLDRSVIEIYANDRQAIARRVYPSLGGTGVKLFAKGGNVAVVSVKAWEMMPSNPY